MVNGSCVSSGTCPEGYALVNGQCEYQQSPNCPSGQVYDNDGVCHPGSCPTGQVNIGGRCQTPPPTCPAGQEMVNGACQTACPVGQSLVNGICTDLSTITCNGGTIDRNTPTGAPRCTCPPGQTLTNGTCGIPPVQPLCIGGVVVQGMCMCPSPLVLNSSGVCAQQAQGGGGGGGDGGNNGGGNGGNGGGGTGGSGNGNGQGVDTCALHPNAAGCVVDSATDGTCGSPGNWLGIGATGDSPPSCSGDAAACAQLRVEFLAACAGKRLADLQGPSDDELTAATSDPTASKVTDEINGSSLDESGFLGAADCPQIPSISVLGTTLTFPPVWCELFAWIGELLLIGAYIVAIRILGS
jgi:hypothetical protein